MRNFVKLFTSLLLLAWSICINAEDIYTCENEQGINLHYMDMSEFEFSREVVVINYNYDRYEGELIIPDHIAVPDWNDESRYVQAKVVGIWANAFYHNDKLTKVTLPSTLRYINSNAFYMCARLEEINFPEGLMEIQYEAFKYCYALKNVRVTARTIDNCAFDECRDLEEVTFSPNVSQVCAEAFINCNKIKRVIIEDGPGEIFFGGGLNANNPVFGGSTLESVYAGKGYDYDYYPFAGVRKPELGQQVTVIPPYYYQNDPNDEITIREGITKIGRYAFSNSQMTTLNVPTTLSRIESYAFNECTNLQELDLSHCSSEMQFGDKVFGKCTSLQNVQLPNGMTTIANNLFSNCSSLTYIGIPQSLKTIGGRAFQNCANLKKVDIPENLTVIGDYAFDGSGLTEFIIPNGIDSIGEYAFRGTPLRSIYIPDKVEKIEAGTFSGCSLLTEIRLSPQIVEIGESALSNCSSLETIDIPEGLTIISERMLYGCKNLKEVRFASSPSVKIIGERAFAECNSLTDINIPNTITQIGSGAFSNCTSLASFVFPNSLRSQGMRGYELSGCRSLKEVTLPNIDDEERWQVLRGTFSGCTSLAQIKIPPCVTQIQENTFTGCTVLHKVIIEEGSTTLPDNWDILIDKNTFTDNPLDSLYVGRNMSMRYASRENSGLHAQKHLKIVIIGDDVTKLDANTFPDCCIEKLVLGRNLTSIGENCFIGTIPDTVRCLPTLPADMSSTKGLREALIYVPSGTGSTYREHEAWTQNLIIDDKDTRQYVNMKYAGTLIASMKQQGITNPCNVTQLKIDGNINNSDWDVIRNDFPHLYYLDISNITGDSIPVSQFEGNYKLQDIILSDKVLQIGADAFKGCTHLRENTLVLPSCTYVGERAFAESCIKSVHFTKPVTLGESSFRHSDIHQIEFMASAIIGENSFRDCFSLMDVSFNAGNCRIDSAAFYGCEKLEHVLLSGAVKEIPSYAFYGCKALSGISLPATGTNVGAHAFEGCSSLPCITLQGSDYVVKEYAFANSGIQTAYIEDGITSLGQYAFMGCEKLSGTLTLPTSIKTISTGLFKNCPSLEKVCLSPGVKRINSESFAGCTALNNISLPHSLNTIESAAFEGCQSLEEIEIPKEILDMNGAFSGCANLKHITTHWRIPLPISSDTFNNVDEDLCILTVPANAQVCYLTAENWKVFWRIEEDETDIVKRIEFADVNVKKICVSNWDVDEDNELWEDEVLRVKSIGTIFSNNSEIESFDEIRYFKALNSFESRSFQACRNLSSLFIPDFIHNIASDAFVGCTNLATIKVAADNIVYDSRDGSNALILSSQDQLLLGCKNTSIPNTIKSIADSAFVDCKGLENIVFPNSVAKIGNAAFSGCTNLKSIVLPMSLLNVGASVFEGCTALEMVDLGNGLQTISNKMFRGCSSLHSIHVGKNVSLIEGNVFDNCSNLTTVYLDNLDIRYKVISYSWGLAKNIFGGQVKNYILGESITTIPNSAFKGCDSLENVMIPNSINQIGESAFSACKSLVSISIPISVLEIQRMCFRDCENLVHVDLPQNLMSISFQMFYGCKNLETIDIPSNVVFIDAQSFEDCSSLKEINLPSNLETINNNAFRKCTGLTSIRIPEGVKFIGGGAFYECGVLDTISIPRSVSTIGILAFPLIRDAHQHVFVEWDSPAEINVDYNNNVFYHYKQDMYGHILHVPSGTKSLYSSADLWKDFGRIWEPAVIGDINDDGEIDVGDIAGQIFVLLETGNEDLRYDAADINGDGKVRVDDLTDLLSMILDEEPINYAKMRNAAMDDMEENKPDMLMVAVNNDKIEIAIQNDEETFTGLQFDLMLPDGVFLENVAMSPANENHNVFWKVRNDGTYRVVLYSMNNQPLSAQDGHMMTVSIEVNGEREQSRALFYNVVSTTPHAKSLRLMNKEIDLQGGVTGMDAVSIAEKIPNQATGIFDMSGRLIRKTYTQDDIKQLPTGVYIINGKKVVIK